MKKFLTLLGIAVCSLAYSQGGTLILNNYSAYDFKGFIVANNFSGGCYPYVSSNNPDMVKVPANSHMGNGNELRYDNYRDQYTSSLYPMTSWGISLSATTLSLTRPWNHPSLMPGGVFSISTKWATTKFVMYYPGTTTLAPDDFNGAIAVAGNSCYGASDNMVSSTGNNSAEIFTISNGGINYTYIQLY